MKKKFLLLIGIGIWGFLISGCVALQKDVSRVERVITTKEEDWRKKYASLSEEIVGLGEKIAENEGAISALLVRIEKSDEKAENFRNQASQELVSLQKGSSSQIEDLSSQLKKIQKDVEENSKRISEISLSLNEMKDLTKTLNEKYESKLTAILDEIKKENERLIKEIERVKKRPTPQFHIVKEGETISAIASLYKVSPEEILKVNHISDPNKISVGQRLIIPGKGEGE